MNDSIDKYINKSKNNLNTIIKCLETNIEFLDNNLWNSFDEVNDVVKNIIDIYYEHYYLYTSNDFSKIDKYIRFSNKINRKLKTILMSIIDYYERQEKANIIKDKEGSILYLTILIYISLTLYDKKFVDIDTPKKLEKVINSIIDNFARIRFRREKDLIGLINNIKEVIIFNNRFNERIELLSTKENKNTFISINKDNNYYKVMYEKIIEKLNDYDEKDISIVNSKLNISSVLTTISYDLCYYTMFKLMKNGMDYKFLFPINKQDLMNDKFRDGLINKNKKIGDRIKFLVNYKDIKGDYEFVNLMKDKNIDVFIEIDEPMETNNYNMFMDVQNVVVPEEFISINEKYVEIWKDMEMNFVIKNLGIRLNEKDLILRK